MLAMHDITASLEIIKVRCALGALSLFAVRSPPSGQFWLAQHGQLERWQHATLHQWSYDDMCLAAIGELGIGVKR